MTDLPQLSSDERLDRWLRAVVGTPGLTATRDLDAARTLHIDGVLHASRWLEPGSLVDVGSGGGSPGIPLAAAREDVSVTLLEATGKKAAFLRRWAAEFQNVTVHQGRAEEWAAADGREMFDTAIARALAPPAVALEWALPLVKVGGRFLLFTTSRDQELIAGVAPVVGGRLVEVDHASDSDRALCVVEKCTATPTRFPRRTGIARKRPLRPAIA